jgi:PAS domain S-box-containing protein
MKCMELQRFIADTPFAVALFDGEMRYVAASPRWLVEHDLDIIAGQPAVFRDADAEARMRDAFLRALMGETILLPVARGAEADGGVRWTRTELRPWRSGQDEIVGVVASIADVSSDFHRRLIDEAASGVCLLDAEGNIAYASARMAEILGAAGQALIGAPLSDFLAPEHAATREKLVTATEQSFDARLLRRDDTQAWVSLRCRPHIEDSACSGLLVTATDVTDRKGREAEMVTQLRLAEESNHRKSRFLGSLAHDFRTPLATITLTLETLVAEIREDGQNPPGYRAALERILRQGRRLTRLVGELADVSALCQDKFDPPDERVDLLVLLSETIERARHRMTEKGCELVTHLHDDALPVLGDATLLTQAFHTLLDNAAKYSRPGGRILLEARRSGTNAVVTVRDEGAGIAADVLPLIFEPFERSRPAGGKADGLGVALALARAWFRLHGGDIEAESAGKDKGAVFVARLPLSLA